MLWPSCVLTLRIKESVPQILVLECSLKPLWWETALPSLHVYRSGHLTLTCLFSSWSLRFIPSVDRTPCRWSQSASIYFGSIHNSPKSMLGTSSLRKASPFRRVGRLRDAYMNLLLRNRSLGGWCWQWGRLSTCGGRVSGVHARAHQLQDRQEGNPKASCPSVRQDWKPR